MATLEGVLGTVNGRFLDLSSGASLDITWICPKLWPRPLFPERVVFNGQATIAVLGPGQDSLDPDVGQLARDVGYALGAAGYTLIAMGGRGVGEIAVTAAKRAGGECVRVVTPEDEPVEGCSVIETETPLDRLNAVLQVADGVMVLPGDLAALAIVLEIWSYGLTRQAPYRQVVLAGDKWPAIVSALSDAAGLGPKERAMMTFAESATAGVEALRYFVQPS